MRKIRLGVNIDHVATLRQARRGREPDPVHAAVAAELGGADQITFHLREDRRHIQDRDLPILREAVHTGIDMEMAAVPEMIRIASRLLPDLVTLVPEKRQEITTEGGLEILGRLRPLRSVVRRLQKRGIRVALFVDPVLRQVRACGETGADAIEINTGRYSLARGERTEKEMEKIRRAADCGAGAGLSVHAGHGLNYRNVFPVADVPEIEELNIGHSIVSRAVFVGMERAVREMRDLLP